MDAAFSKLAQAIGDRSGLSSVGELFHELDLDGSGVLDLAEFQEAIKRFGATDVDEPTLEKIFMRIDESGDGCIDFAEFAQIAKIELELLTLNSAQIDASAIESTEAALKSGVRVNRTMSTIGNRKLQGDLQSLTPEAMAKRQALKADPEIRKRIKGWWDAIELKVDNGIDKAGYMRMSLALHKTFVPDVHEQDAMAAAEQDWLTDCPQGQDTLNYQAFFLCVFELCDLWADGTDSSEYEHLFRRFEAAHIEAEKAELRRLAETAKLATDEQLERQLQAEREAVAIAKAAASAARIVARETDKSITAALKWLEGAEKRARMQGHFAEKAQHEAARVAAEAGKHAKRMAGLANTAEAQCQR
eukprot:g1737.t1